MVDSAGAKPRVGLRSKGQRVELAGSGRGLIFEDIETMHKIKKGAVGLPQSQSLVRSITVLLACLLIRGRPHSVAGPHAAIATEPRGNAYPAAMFLTGANDPRVTPWHMMKMAARTQAATPGK